MGAVAYIIVISVALTFLWRRMMRTRNQAPAPKDTSNDYSRRMGSAFSGLNEALPHLGGQPGISLPPEPTATWEDAEDPHIQRIDTPPDPDA